MKAFALGDDHIAACAGSDLGGDQFGGHAAMAKAAEIEVSPEEPYAPPDEDLALARRRKREFED